MKKFLFVIILLGCGGTLAAYWYTNRPPVAPPEPKTEEVLRKPITEKVSATGKIAPRGLVSVGIDLPAARISEVLPGCEVNQRVQKDQALFRLDDTLAQARLKEAESALAAAEASKKQAEAKRDTALAAVNRAQVAFDAANDGWKSQIEINKGQEGSIPKAKLAEAENLAKIARVGVENANAAVEEAKAGILAADALILKAKAGVDVAKKGVELMTITSPISGTILEREKRVMAGQVVSAQMAPLFIIAPDDLQWELYVQVGEYDITKIKLDMPVVFTVEAYSEDTSAQFEGKVSRIADLPTAALRLSDLPAGIAGPVYFTVTVDVLPEKKDVRKAHPLRAGLTANVDFTIKVVTNELIVPNAALNYRPETLTSAQQQEIERELQSRSNVAPLFLYEKGQEYLVFVRPLASDGKHTAVEPIVDAKQKDQAAFKEGAKVVTEGPPPAPKGGLFEKPFKLPG